MKLARTLSLLVLMLAPVISLAGDIQVFCPPGLRVFLNGEFVGVSTAREDGLFLANLPNGAHTVRVEKEGFAPQEFQVQFVFPPIEVKVAEFEPETAAAPETAVAATVVAQPVQQVRQVQQVPQVGKLVVTSAPQNCVVEIDGRSETKTTPQLTIEGLPPGEHKISFSKPGYESITRMVTIERGGTAHIRGNLKTEKVEGVHQGKGSLRLTSEPSGCTVRLLGRTRQKTNQRMNLSYLPAGEHRMIVSWRGRELTTTLPIKNRTRTIVHVSFMADDEPFVISLQPE